MSSHVHTQTVSAKVIAFVIQRNRVNITAITGKFSISVNEYIGGNVEGNMQITEYQQFQFYTKKL